MPQVGFVLVQLLSNCCDARRIAHDAALRALVQHALQAVDVACSVSTCSVSCWSFCETLFHCFCAWLSRSWKSASVTGSNAECASPASVARRAPAAISPETPRSSFGVEPLAEREPRQGDAVEQRERLLFAGLELGESAHAVGRRSASRSASR